MEKYYIKQTTHYLTQGADDQILCNPFTSGQDLEFDSRAEAEQFILQTEADDRNYFSDGLPTYYAKLPTYEVVATAPGGDPWKGCKMVTKKESITL